MRHARHAVAVLVFLFFCFLGSNSAGQPGTLWTRTFGGVERDCGNCVEETSDSGYVVAGWTDSFDAGWVDAWLIRTDSSGDTLWTKVLGGGSEDRGHSVRQTPDGGYAMAGQTASYGAGLDDAWLVRTDQSGNVLWTQTFGGAGQDRAYSLEQTADGGYLVAGTTRRFGSNFDDAFLVKTDASGDTLWTKTLGGSSWDRALSVQQTADEGYVIAGDTRSYGAGYYDAWLIKTDASGDTAWTRVFGGQDYDGAASARQTADGGYIVAGYTESFGPGLKDVWLIKTDASGNTLWTRTYGEVGQDDQGYSVQQTPDGGYVVAGHTGSYGAGATLDDVWLIRTDESGDTLWTRVFGGIYDDVGNSVRQTSGGGYVIAGCTASYGAGSQDVWLIKTGPEAAADEIGGLSPPRLRLQVYPNPFRHFCSVIRPHGRGVLRVFELTGRLIEAEDTERLGAGLRPGIYLVKYPGCEPIRVVKVR